MQHWRNFEIWDMTNQTKSWCNTESVNDGNCRSFPQLYDSPKTGVKHKKKIESLIIEEGHLSVMIPPDIEIPVYQRIITWRG